MLQVKYRKGLHFWMDAKWNRDITSDLIIDFRVRGLWTWSWCKHSRNPCVEAVWRDYDASNRVFSITRVGLFFVATQNTSSSITHITIKQLSRPAISLFHYTELSNVCKQFQSNRHDRHWLVKRCESSNFKCVRSIKPSYLPLSPLSVSLSLFPSLPSYAN